MADRQLMPNVMEFLHKAAAMYGQVNEEAFAQRRFSELSRREQSPIEDIFWIAMQVTAEAECLDFNRIDGVEAVPQVEIGPYRVDFLVYEIREGMPHGPQIVVELDGHDFHDKDKRQRSYEKRRDRDLVRAGYKVLHFTGSDVVRDPFMVTHEVLALLGLSLRDKYDPADPLGQGI